MKQHIYPTLLLVFILIFSATVLKGQPCNKEEAMNKTGIWKRNTDARLNGNENATIIRYTKQITAIVDTIGSYIIQAYPNPVGSQVEWNRVYQPPDSLTMPDPTLASYLYSAPFQPYVCENGKIVPNLKGNNWLQVSVNNYYKSGVSSLEEMNTPLHKNLGLSFAISFPLSPEKRISPV